MRCDNCGNESPEGSKFCIKCGKEFKTSGPAQCPHCGADISEGTTFCPSCGRSVAAPEGGTQGNARYEPLPPMADPGSPYTSNIAMDVILTLITCGSMIPNPSELLGSERMQKFIEGITQRYSIVIFDTPPLLAASDAVVLGTLVDGICMIVLAGKTKRKEVLRKMELFQHVQAKVHGIVLNCAGVEVAHDGYSYYAY